LIGFGHIHSWDPGLADSLPFTFVTQDLNPSS